MGPLLPALIAGGAALAGSGINALSQGSMNKKTRQWNEKMYHLQNARDLANWNMQNDYNSPTSQMQRLREGGLNPNLVYGNGTSTVASAPPSTDMAQWSPRAPEIDLGTAAATGLNQYFDTQVKNATVDNLKAQNTVLTQDAALKAATTGKTLSDTARSNFDLAQADRLKDISAQAAEANLRKTNIDSNFQLSENERRQALNSSTIREAAERILKSRSDRATSAEQRKQIASQIHDLNSSAELKDLDIKLRKQGINPSDPAWMRVLGQALDTQGLSKGWELMKGDVRRGTQWLKDKFKK